MAAKKKPKAAATTEIKPDEMATYYTLPLSDPAGARFQVDLLFYEPRGGAGPGDGAPVFPRRIDLEPRQAI